MPEVCSQKVDILNVMVGQLRNDQTRRGGAVGDENGFEVDDGLWGSAACRFCLGAAAQPGGKLVEAP